jgi:hypothetical protein
MAIIQKYCFQKSPDANVWTKAAKAAGAVALCWRVLVLWALLVAAASVTARAQQIHRQGGSGGNTATIPRALVRQSSEAPTPVPAPAQNVLVIPKASTDFVGEWGGHVALTHATAGLSGQREAIVSLAFGVRNGEVFMQTTAFAGPNSRIVSTTARVVNPRRIEIKLEGIEYAFRPPLRHVEELYLALTRKNTIDCLKFVDFYASGARTPLISMDYHGTLHPLTPAQREALRREVAAQGEVPQIKIESSRRFGP